MGRVRTVALPGFSKGGHNQGFGGETPSHWRLRGSAAKEFSQFLQTLILAHFFIEKGHAVSAVTIDNAKIFSQLMSKSRSLAKL